MVGHESVYGLEDLNRIGLGTYKKLDEQFIFHISRGFFTSVEMKKLKKNDQLIFLLNEAIINYPNIKKNENQYKLGDVKI